MFGRYIFFTECVHLFFGMFFRILLLQLFCFCCVFAFAYASAVFFSLCCVFLTMFLCFPFCLFFFASSILLLWQLFCFCFLFLLTFLALQRPALHTKYIYIYILLLLLYLLSYARDVPRKRNHLPHLCHGRTFTLQLALSSHAVLPCSGLSGNERFRAHSCITRCLS